MLNMSILCNLQVLEKCSILWNKELEYSEAFGLYSLMIPLYKMWFLKWYKFTDCCVTFDLKQVCEHDDDYKLPVKDQLNQVNHDNDKCLKFWKAEVKQQQVTYLLDIFIYAGHLSKHFSNCMDIFDSRGH